MVTYYDIRAGSFGEPDVIFLVPPGQMSFAPYADGTAGLCWIIFPVDIMMAAINL